ncbi:hypothetical protein TRFO_32762 [Tritrichomonas foetus]|uniref:Phosphoprotein phosphatase n=1 Tax=Tritrichomonas foetus TaxID=1144522 RepID=A0A1J4JSM6_9EUKA|nr:hypothetical protein TRFO_32762 [Tritrichomonas foetus]|eukprot:OHT00526.1 hypothetical protein TRFO_32762 [Tritrichomonas foetus]
MIKKKTEIEPPLKICDKSIVFHYQKLLMLKNRYTRKEASALTVFNPSPSKNTKFQQLYNACRRGVTAPIKNQSHSNPILLSKNEDSRPRQIIYQTNVPLSDVNIPSSMANCSFLEIPQEFIIDILPDMPPVFSSKFHDIFEKKVKLCKQQCAFLDEKKEELSILCKTNALNEILHLFSGSTAPTNTMEDDEIDLLFDMLKTNIIRKIPIIEKNAYYFDDLPSLYVPSWPHLSIVYQILNRLVLCIPCSPLFNIDLLKEFIPIFDTPDSNERGLIVQFFTNLLNNNFNPAIHLLSFLERALIDHISDDDDRPPFRISTILPIVHLIFNLSPNQLPIFSRVFSKAIVPLLADRYMTSFVNPLQRLIEFFVEDNAVHAKQVVHQILKTWPKMKSTKQSYFMNILNDTLPRMNYREIVKCVEKVFIINGYGLTSLHEKVALASLSMWNRLEIERIIAGNTKAIMPIALPALAKTVSAHWSQQVRQTAKMTLSMLAKYDNRLAQEYLNMGNLTQAVNNGKSGRTWASIVKQAQANDKSINVSQKINEIINSFGLPTEDKTALTSARSAPIDPRPLIRTPPEKSRQFIRSPIKNMRKVVHSPKLGSGQGICPLPRL